MTAGIVEALPSYRFQVPSPLPLWLGAGVEVQFQILVKCCCTVVITAVRRGGLNFRARQSRDSIEELMKTLFDASGGPFPKRRKHR
ncbi:MAG: hypothetical protein QGG73_09230 [Candidatus Hydrogenedentes bacterium]|nr:hypothetical protein [Candidatus Hydrogenedentota bacterium]